jgi:hypothetical protein
MHTVSSSLLPTNPKRFLFSKALAVSVCNPDSNPPRTTFLETASACVIFNTALNNHLIGLKEIDSKDGFRLRSLQSAGRLYELVLETICRVQTNALHQEDAAVVTILRQLQGITMNNLGSLLLDIGGENFQRRAREIFQTLLTWLNSVDQNQHVRTINTCSVSPLSLVEEDFAGMAANCFSELWGMKTIQTLAPAA